VLFKMVIFVFFIVFMYKCVNFFFLVCVIKRQNNFIGLFMQDYTPKQRMT